MRKIFLQWDSSNNHHRYNNSLKKDGLVLAGHKTKESSVPIVANHNQLRRKIGDAPVGQTIPGNSVLTAANRLLHQNVQIADMNQRTRIACQNSVRNVENLFNTLIILTREL